MNGLLLVASLFGCVKAKIALANTAVPKASAAKACATVTGAAKYSPKAFAETTAWAVDLTIPFAA